MSPGYGIVSLFLVIFTICMVVFATISFSTARVDYKFSDKTVDIIKHNYILEEEMQRYLMQIDEILFNIKHSDKNTYNEGFKQDIKNLEFIKYDEVSDTYILKTDIINGRFLESIITINDNDNLNKNFHVISYFVVVISNDSIDKIEVWEG